MVENAIILAAGYGSRLAELSSSKPLARVHGVSLIEIAVRQAASAGAKRIVVVTGHQAERVEAELRAIGAGIAADIVAVRLDDWSKPNGWSVIAGARAVDGPFLLMMADHVFGDGLLQKLAAQSLADCDVVLAIDRADNPLLDPEDATWVALRVDNSISRIGKEISPFDAVDCGAFLASHALPRAIEQAIAAGKGGSLSDGMQVLADMARANVMDVEGTWWLDVDDPRAHALCEQQAHSHLGMLEGEAAHA